MSEEKFWDYIHKSVDKTYKDDEKLLSDLDEFGMDEVQSLAIKGLLKIEGIEEAKLFQKKLGEKTHQLYLPHIAEIFLICGYKLGLGKKQYFSTDGFIDFRAWIVGLGEKSFSDYLHLTKEDDIFKPLMVPDINTSNREDLVYAAIEVVHSFDENIDVEYYFDGDYEKLNNSIEWDKLDKKYPKLWGMYQ